MQITGADLFVKALKAEAVEILFAYPGGQAIDLFNALYGVEDISVVLPRHEQDWCIWQTAMPALQAGSEYVW